MKHPNAAMHDFQQLDDVPAQPFVQFRDYENIADTLSQVPQAFRPSLLKEYERLYSEYQCDQENPMTKKAARLNALRYFLGIQTYVKDQTFLNHSDENLRTKAKRYALAVARLIGENNYQAGCQFSENRGIAIPHKHWERLASDWKLAQQSLDQRLIEVQADNNDQEIVRLEVEINNMTAQWQSIKARLTNDQWWIKQLIKLHDRQFEQAAIRFAQVRKHRQAYVSDITLDKILSRQKRSLEIMQGLLAVSDEGDEVEMLDIIQSSSANPVIRRIELMNRLHGFEQYAEANKHVSEFYTLTAPSKYHPNSAKYNHWTPRETQQNYFSPLWAKIRAKFKDNNLCVYGFRIAEPHADACPHWHILLFMPLKDRLEVRNILKDYALREDGDENGAAKNRFDYETITKQKGSAIGYIAKYISKNVDGFGMGDEQTDDGSDLGINESVQRVRAWASVWGIRQFQQIGGSSISIWRELRRLKNAKQTDKTIEAARKAADSGDWKAYLDAQGGTNTPMKNQPIQLYHQPYCDKNTGELQTNQYGEIIHRIKGIQANNLMISTRSKHWFIQEKPTEDSAEKHQLLPAKIATTEPLDVVIQRLLTPIVCTDVAAIPPCISGIATLDATTALAFDLPWSSVNNCRNPEIAHPKDDKLFIKAVEKMFQNYVKSGKKVSIKQSDFIKTILKMI